MTKMKTFSSHISVSIFILGIIATIGCNTIKAGSSNNSISCIQKSINDNKNNPDWPVSSIDEYTFQGKLVYAFNPPKNYADASLPIKTSDCKNLCNVGGFMGRKNSNCNGDNFFEKAVLKRRIWSREK